jgi:hypothetical protein
MTRRRFALAAGLVLLLVASFSIPAVRAAASDILGLFRVQKFAPISISPEQIARLEELAESGLYPGTFEMLSEPSEPRPVASAQEAAATAGFTPRTPSDLMPADQIAVMSGGQGRLVIDVAGARALMEAAGGDPILIPDSLDGQAVNVTLFPSVAQEWADDTVLVQTPSPLVEYPAGVDPAAIGRALLEALGMEPRQARRLANSIDWTNTLLLPVPRNLATFTEVTVDGVSGLAITILDESSTSLLWQKDGMVYLLTGRNLEDLARIGDSLR